MCFSSPAAAAPVVIPATPPPPAPPTPAPPPPAPAAPTTPGNVQTEGQQVASNKPDKYQSGAPTQYGSNASLINPLNIPLGGTGPNQTGLAIPT